MSDETPRQVVTLDNGSITLLAIAIAHASKLMNDGETIGPMVNKLQIYLDDIRNNVQHFER